MGAGYKTAIPQYVDNKMLQLPYQLMSQVLQNKTQGVDDSYAETAAFEDMIKAKHLERDTEITKELLAQYEDEAYNITEAISKDPLNYKKQMRKVKELSRKLDKDLTSGQLAAIESRYNDDVAFSKKLEESDVSDEYRKLKRRAALNELGDLNWNPDTGTYNKYRAGNITEDVDVNAKLEEYMKGVDADVESMSFDAERGVYEIKTFAGTTKTITQDKIFDIVQNKMAADPELMASIQDRASLNNGRGMTGYENLYDDKGRLRMIDEVGEVKHRTANGSWTTSSNIKYSDNILGNAMSGINRKYRKYDTNFDTGSKATPGANAIKAHELAKLDEPTSVIVTDKVRIDNGIDTADDLAERQATIESGKTALVTAATEKLTELYGRELSESEQELLLDGEFDLLFRGMENTENFDPKTINAFKEQHTTIMRQQAITDAYHDEFAAQATPVLNPQSYAPDAVGEMIHGENPEYYYIGDTAYSKQEFDTFVKERNNVSIDVKSGFIDASRPQQEAMQADVKGLIESGRAEFIINDSTDVTTLSKLIDGGAVKFKTVGLKQNDPEMEAKQAEIARLRGLPERTEEEDKTYDRLMGEMIMNPGVSFEYIPGSDLANFEVNEESILPEQQLGQGDKPQFTAGLNYNGKSVKVNVTNVSSPQVNAYYERNRDAFKINKLGSQYSGLTKVGIPATMGTDGSIEYAQDMHYNPKQQTVSYKMNGQEMTVNIFSQDDMAVYVREKLFGIQPIYNE